MLNIYEGLSYFTREYAPLGQVESLDDVCLFTPFVIVAESYAETLGLEYKLEGFHCFISTTESEVIESHEVDFDVYLKAYLHFHEYPKVCEFPSTFEELLEDDLALKYPSKELCTLDAVNSLLTTIDTKYYYVPNEDLDGLMETLSDFGYDGISSKCLDAIFNSVQTGTKYQFRVMALPCAIKARTLMYAGMYEEPIAEEVEEPVVEVEQESHEILDRVLAEESREEFDSDFSQEPVETSIVFKDETPTSENQTITFCREDEFVKYVESVMIGG